MRILDSKKIEEGTISLIEFGANEKLHVRNANHIDISRFFKKRGYDRNSGEEYITFSKKILILCKNYDFQQKACAEIFHAREPVEGVEPKIRQVQADVRLFAAISNQDIKPLSMNQFQFLILFEDEIAIGNFEKKGKSGWIVRKPEMKEYMEELPAIKDCGLNQMMWVAYHKNKEVLFFWDNKPKETEEVTEIISVEYDFQSFIIKDLTSNSFGKVKFVLYNMQQGRRLYIGYRLPYKMRPPESRNCN
jgi:hypothetical protein